MDYDFNWFRLVFAGMAIAALLLTPWLSISAAGGSIDYGLFKVRAAELSATYPEMVLRYEEGQHSIDIALAAKLAPYMKLFQLWAIVTIGLFLFAAFAENQRRLYLASAASLLLMVLAYFAVAYHVTSSLHLVSSPQDLILGKALKVQLAFMRTYLTLQLGMGWWAAILTGAFMLVYGLRYRYWKLVAMW